MRGARLISLVCAWFCALASLPLCAAEPPRSAHVRFDRDIQPIFSRHCITCHGATEKNGGLGLSDREAALGELDSGLRAIVAGHPEQSELLRRVASSDPSERMPPKGEPLTAREIELLRHWIMAGAQWPSHWAYRPLERPSLPIRETLVDGEWARTPIDLFILEQLQAHELRPSPPADKRTWLRRVTLDLTGLPPNPEEREALLADDGPDAQDRVVERLLASPHYGERWARHWMDLVHFAETHGHDQDRPRPNAWPYRDYLIRAFNDDRPYARFIQEQVAGDVLFPGDPQALIATGFLATGPWDESSLRDIQENTIDREIARYLDRDDIVTTVMATFTSTTVHCARCHDHKFDPVTQTEYYALQAVFAGTGKGDRLFDRDPQVAERRRALADRKARLPALIAAVDPSLLESNVQASVAEWERQVSTAAEGWLVIEPQSASSENGSTLTVLPDRSILSGGERPATDVYTITARTDLQGITGVRLEVLTDESLPHHGPGRQENGNLHLNEFSLSIGPAGKAAEARPISLRNPRADFDQQGWTIAMAVDGNPRTAWGIHPEVGKPHRAVFELAEPIHVDGDAVLTFRLEQSHRAGHLIGRPRLSLTTAPLPLVLDGATLPAEIAGILAVPHHQRTDSQRAELAGYYVAQQLDRELAELPPQERVYSGSNAFEPDGSFRPIPAPRAVHVLHRGDIGQPGDEAAPGALTCIPGLEQPFSLGAAGDDGARRAALARWLADPRNVLTWRSIANRVWHGHFGRGLVDTPNDFGRMGSTPTHPELLDWLAVELLESGGSLKHLHRLIVTSATYRQCAGAASETLTAKPPGCNRGASAHDAPHSLDAENRYLWRMNRTRLDAESIRDSVLQVAGSLDRTMGGPSVKQFIQTPGIHVTPNVDYLGFDVDSSANHRRSVYRFIFRTLPDPFMESLDCPDSSQLTPDRSESVTALQALAMLNNRFIVRQSERLAKRIERENAEVGTAGTERQIELLYDLVLGREPSGEERAAFVAYTLKHGLPNACRVLFNSNEFMFVE